MGQRLNIEIKRKKDNKDLANCYYHWSAYTGSALKLTIEIMQNFIDYHEEDNNVMRAIKLLQSTGAGVIEEDYDTLNKEEQKYCKIGDNRNLGLISITEKNMEETRQWEESRVEIYLTDEKNYFKGRDENRASFWCLFSEDKEDTKEYLEEEIKNGSFNIEDLIEFDFDLDDMKLEDLIELYSRIDEIEDNYCGRFKVKGQIYCAIY